MAGQDQVATSRHPSTGALIRTYPFQTGEDAEHVHNLSPKVGCVTPAAEPITDDGSIVGAQACADQVGQNLRDKGMLFPRQANILETEGATATRVAELMFDQGLATVDRLPEIRPWIEAMLYKPEYRQDA